jgi:hypothetical protein
MYERTSFIYYNKHNLPKIITWLFNLFLQISKSQQFRRLTGITPKQARNLS